MISVYARLHTYGLTNMLVAVRSARRRGNSLTFTLPSKWVVPEVLHEYVSEDCLVLPDKRARRRVQDEVRRLRGIR